MIDRPSRCAAPPPAASEAKHEDASTQMKKEQRRAVEWAGGRHTGAWPISLRRREGESGGGEAEGGAARRFRITNPPLYI